jgi:hypothetical protein
VTSRQFINAAKKRGFVYKREDHARVLVKDFSLLPNAEVVIFLDPAMFDSIETARIRIWQKQGMDEFIFGHHDHIPLECVFDVLELAERIIGAGVKRRHEARQEAA